MITPQALPDVQYPDIYNYLISTASVYTKDLKAYKNLEAYKYLLADWVSKVSAHSVEDSNEKMILYAKVRHSQAVKTSPLLPWAATHRDGTYHNMLPLHMYGRSECGLLSHSRCIVCCGNLQQAK